MHGCQPTLMACCRIAGLLPSLKCAWNMPTFTALAHTWPTDPPEFQTGVLCTSLQTARYYESDSCTLTRNRSSQSHAISRNVKSPAAITGFGGPDRSVQRPLSCRSKISLAHVLVAQASFQWETVANIFGLW